MTRNRREQAPAKKLRGAAGKPNKGNFKKGGDPRINYAGRPPGVLQLRELMRETGEQKALNTLLDAMNYRGENLPTAVRAASTWLTYATPELTNPPAIIEHTGSVRVMLSRLTDEELELYERLTAKARAGAEPGELPTGEAQPETQPQPQ